MQHHPANRAPSSTTFRGVFFTAALLGAAALPLAGCDRPEPRSPTVANTTSPQARIVERSAQALREMRGNPRFAAIDGYLKEARGILIFPRVVKASLIVGGEGGNGIMVARKADGSWSEPAFYSLGAPSIGLQIGYQETTVVLFLMDDAMVTRALGSSLTLGTQAGVALGNALEPGGTHGASLTSARVYQAVESDGVYAGVSLDGYVIHSREGHNAAYYGSDASARKILLDGTERRAENAVLRQVLSGR